MNVVFADVWPPPIDRWKKRTDATTYTRCFSQFSVVIAPQPINTSVHSPVLSPFPLIIFSSPRRDFATKNVSTYSAIARN